MLTVKLVRSGGQELIYEAESVIAESGPTTSEQKIVRLYTSRGGEPSEILASDGVVYVMNAAGQTIARYWLGDPRCGEAGTKPVGREIGVAA